MFIQWLLNNIRLIKSEMPEKHLAAYGIEDDQLTPWRKYIELKNYNNLTALKIKIIEIKLLFCNLFVQFLRG